MRAVPLIICLATIADMGPIQGSMQHAFYPVLLLVLVVASLGVPIPEDIPLIAAGVLLNTHPGIATWEGTLAVALVGIMSGDLVLYGLGRRWGPDVVNHRLVRRLISRRRFLRLSERFHRHGIWVVFVGRFIVGLRAAMCMTAGATRFPRARFFLADLAGALVSIPLFVGLGYWFADVVPTLRAYVVGAQELLVAGLVAAVAIGLLLYRRRRRKKGPDPVVRRVAGPAAGRPPGAPGAWRPAPGESPSRPRSPA